MQLSLRPLKKPASMVTGTHNSFHCSSNLMGCLPTLCKGLCLGRFDRLRWLHWPSLKRPARKDLVGLAWAVNNSDSVGFGCCVFNRQERKNEFEIAQDQRKTDLEIGESRNQESVLQNYLDKMNEVNSRKHLRETKSFKKHFVKRFKRRMDGKRSCG